MKRVNARKEIPTKGSSGKIVVNEKAIPKGHQCYTLKEDSFRKVWVDGIKSETESFSLRMCPFLDTILVTDEGDVTEFCRLLKTDVEYGMKECDYNRGETPYFNLIDYLTGGEPNVDEFLDAHGDDEETYIDVDED